MKTGGSKNTANYWKLPLFNQSNNEPRLMEFIYMAGVQVWLKKTIVYEQEPQLHG